jgi:hypothetical protein
MWKTLKRGRVISLKGQVWAHETSLTLSLCIAPNQECNKEIPECRNSSKSQEKQNHRKKMKNNYYPIVVTVPKSNKKNKKKQNRYSAL